LEFSLGFATNFPFFSIMLLTFCGILVPILSSRAARAMTLAVTAVCTAFSALLLSHTGTTGKSFTYMMGHFPAPFGNEIRAGNLEALMALALCAVTLFSLLGSIHSTAADIPPKKQNLFYTMINMLLASLLALVYTNDIFTAYVFIEINTIASCAIVMSKPGGRTATATLRYLVMSLIGSGFFLLAITLLYDLTGHLLMPNIKTAVRALVASGQYTLPFNVILGFFFVSMAIKSALYPFHTWLPDAHANATTSASAILSGLVLKGYIILLIKLFYRVFTPDIVTQLHIAPVILTLGLLGMVMGSLDAMRQGEIKRMIAYSSVAQIGYIYVGIGLNTTAGIVAALFHTVVHMVTKPMLFTAAGGLMDASRHGRWFDELRGAARRDVIGGVAFVVGALSMIGIPLLAGFSAKIYLAVASMGDSLTMCVTLAALGLSTVLNALYYIPALSCLYGAEKENSQVSNHRTASLPATYTLALIVFITLNVSIGLFSQPLIRILEQGLQTFG
jgi:multicomponent Na+:H+ antiporter subunit D